MVENLVIEDSTKGYSHVDIEGRWGTPDSYKVDALISSL